MKRYLYDLETDGLLDEVTTIWCIVIQDLDSGVVWKYRPNEVKHALVKLNEADYLSGHNIITYDNRVLKKLHKWEPRSEVEIFDTLVACRTMWPHISALDVTFRAQLKRKGYTMPSYLFTKPHSLKSWSYRISGGDPARSKFHYDDWTHYTEEMLEYCCQDVAVNCALWKYIMTKGFSTGALDTEHKCHTLFTQMEEAGVPFDEPKAVELYSTVSEKRLQIMDKLIATVPPREVQLKTKVKTIPFNPGSRPQIETYLRANGWAPTQFTESGRAQVTEETLIEAAGELKGAVPDIELLYEYLLLTKRAGQISDGKNGWLKLVKKGKIHGRISHMGTVTSRCSHQSPNLGQVPAAHSPYGKECRELFYAPDGYTFVGTDLSGLELRMLAHYMALYDGGEYADIVVNGDVHTKNMEAAGLESRNTAKTMIYCYLYGGGDAKLGKTIGKSEKEAKKVRAKFEKSLPALKKLRDGVSKAAERGYLIALDGRKTPVRAKHAALNTLLQGAGAIVAKNWVIGINESYKREQLDARIALMIHDESDAIVVNKDVPRSLEIPQEVLNEVQMKLKMKVPLGCETKTGRTWYDIH